MSENNDNSSSSTSKGSERMRSSTDVGTIADSEDSSGSSACYRFTHYSCSSSPEVRSKLDGVRQGSLTDVSYERSTASQPMVANIDTTMLGVDWQRRMLNVYRPWVETQESTIKEFENAVRCILKAAVRRTSRALSKPISTADIVNNPPPAHGP
ncbi:unnamed protein product [Dibothriocephalus latus]|uniref:Uncharacterized protein n=1 Tax=Dibothriocephalus latus TaxID=60516 RepID=A0A3P6QRP9_DIBLA|nr:unnamed protein product [Dibothriocephalus latus]